MRVMTITNDRSEVVVRVRGEFDRGTAARLHRVVTDYLEGGGEVADLVLDLRATRRCHTSALRSLEGLVGAGMRLRTGPRRPEATRRERGRAASEGGR